jgi:hypothetical protein
MKHLNITFEIFFRLKQFQFNGCKMRKNILVKELDYHLKQRISMKESMNLQSPNGPINSTPIDP